MLTTAVSCGLAVKLSGCSNLAVGAWLLRMRRRRIGDGAYDVFRDGHQKNWSEIEIGTFGVSCYVYACGYLHCSDWSSFVGAFYHSCDAS